MEDRIQPVRITDKETGEVFELDFNRDSIRFAEAREFELENVGKYPETGIRELFFYAFRMHHRNVAKDKTDKLLEKMGGVTEAILTRLIGLFNQARTSNLIQFEDELEKNEKVTVEL